MFLNNNLVIFYLYSLGYPKMFCVQLLSEEDGRTDIVNTAKLIAADYADNNMEEKQINIDNIDKSLKGTLWIETHFDIITLLGT